MSQNNREQTVQILKFFDQLMPSTPHDPFMRVSMGLTVSRKTAKKFSR